MRSLIQSKLIHISMIDKYWQDMHWFADHVSLWWSETNNLRKSLCLRRSFLSDVTPDVDLWSEETERAREGGVQFTRAAHAD